MAFTASEDEISTIPWVVDEGRMSMPRGWRLYDGRDMTRADPRWPEEPVTRTVGFGSAIFEEFSWGPRELAQDQGELCCVVCPLCC